MLVGRSRADLSEMLDKLHSACTVHGLEINQDKTVALTNTGDRQAITVAGLVIRIEENARYLGFPFSLPLSQDHEISARLNLAWYAFGEHRKILTNPKVPMIEKRMLFERCITPTFLYGCECWSLTQTQKEKIRVEQRKMERKMIRIKLMDKVRNERIRQITKLKDWITEATVRKVKWVRYISCMEEGRWAKVVTEWTPYTHYRNRSRGRPNLRWRDELRSLMGRRWWNATPQEYDAIITQLSG